MAHLRIAIGALAVVVAFALGVMAQPLRSQDAAAAPAPLRSPDDSPVAGSRNTLTLEIGQQALTEQANALLNGRSLANTPLGTTTLHELSVQVHDDQITVSALADFGPTRLPAQLVAVPQAQNGRVSVHVVAAHLGNMSAPEPVRYQIEQYVQNVVDQALDNAHYEVQRITLGSSKLNVVVRGR